MLRRRDFEDAVDDLFTWQVARGAGLRVPSSTPRAAVGSSVTATFGVGPVRVRVPCRVVYVVDEPDRQGFAYGTLAGHPERGEELFLLSRDPNGAITFSIVAFSQPAILLTRLGGPVGHWVQDRITERYLRALDTD